MYCGAATCRTTITYTVVTFAICFGNKQVPVLFYNYRYTRCLYITQHHIDDPVSQNENRNSVLQARGMIIF